VRPVQPQEGRRADGALSGRTKVRNPEWLTWHLRFVLHLAVRHAVREHGQDAGVELVRAQYCGKVVSDQHVVRIERRPLPVRCLKCCVAHAAR
jgi:hypothetical protein